MSMFKLWANGSASYFYSLISGWSHLNLVLNSKLISKRVVTGPYALSLNTVLLVGLSGMKVELLQHKAWGRPQAPGSKPTSYRAEAYGMLLIMRFLIRLTEYTDIGRGRE